ncbi:MAG: AzlD domain-containing protein [Actinobacteria bacterium]|nr:AzlD domain-containing protein [Actinomycetota bacterium]
MKLVLVILAMGVVTYLLRVIPLLALANRRLPQWLHRFLSGVPVAVLAAFAAPLIFAPEGALDISLHNLHLLAAVPTVAVAVWRRDLLLSVVVGAATMALLRLWL